jgi:hypothetical protein
VASAQSLVAHGAHAYYRGPFQYPGRPRAVATGSLGRLTLEVAHRVSYADLADFFYVWLRRSLGTFYPELFKTMLTPKAAELVATPYRFEGSKSKAKEFFETGLGKSFEFKGFP